MGSSVYQLLIYATSLLLFLGIVSVSLPARPESVMNRLRTEGECAFTVGAPVTWNGLPEETRLAKFVSSFKSFLKSHFYMQALI